VDISFVVIGFNEADLLGPCLESVKYADLGGLVWELIYVDGGSSDRSREIATEIGVQRVLGGERRRKAAENRNLGLAVAVGHYVQFLDGDMVMDPAWPKEAKAVLDRDVTVSTVCGILEERNQSAVYAALQLDWAQPKGPVAYCGGAAMHRREVLQAIGGFPEDVAFGEEPYMCWRLRNEMERVIYHIPRRMALHDLAYKGFGDYWRRSARSGEAYAEIAWRCRATKDPLWSDAVRSNLAWSGGYLLAVCAMLLTPLVAVPLVLLGLVGVLGRKFVQVRRAGATSVVALLYALHTYFAKLNIGYGILRWHLRRMCGPRK